MDGKSTRLLAILLVLTLSVALYTPGVTRAQGPVRGAGLIPASPDRYAPSLPPGLRVGAKLPALVDLSADLPPIGDQGSQDSCVAWATTYYYKTFQEQQERGWGVGTADHQFSPAMTYNLRTKFTPNACTVDEGMRVADAMDILLYDGALPMATLPYSETDTCTQPTAPQLAQAKPYASLGYGAFFVYGEEGHVTPEQVDTLKAHLAGGDLVILGIPVYSPSFTDPVDDIVNPPGAGEDFQRFHTVTLVGYDDAIGGFKFANSWGPTYAGDGYAYLSYAFVEGYAIEAWWMMDRLAINGCVEGVVRDIDGNPVPDVTITLDGPASWTGTTNISGTFATGQILPIGTYTISPSKPGFAFTPGSTQIEVTDGDGCAQQTFVATQGVLWIDPPTQTIGCGETTTYTVGIRDVSNLYGVQFDLTFDPTVIEVIDPDGDPSNGIITPGNIFPPDEYEVAYEVVDNVAGRVEWAISLLRVPKAPPFAGSGPVAVITVRGLADGVSPMVLANAKLADYNGNPIDVLTEDGSITVECRTTLLGYAYLESRTAHDGITVTLEGTGLNTLTDSSGAYSFSNPPSGTYTVSFAYDKFLDVEVGGIAVVENQTTQLCGYTLPAGDLNNDEIVDILDLSFCAAEFGSTAPDADVNVDGIVDIYDLVLIGKNFKLASPQPGICVP